MLIKQEIDVIFRVSNNDIAFRYVIPERKSQGKLVVEKRSDGFRDFPAYTTTFHSVRKSDATMIGWMRTNPVMRRV